MSGRRRRVLLRDPGAVIGLVLLAAMVLLVTTAVGWGPVPGWWKWSASDLPTPLPGGRPTLSLVPEALGGDGIRLGDHPFGQTEVGHDAFARTLRGAQQSLLVVLVVGAVSAVVGTAVGATAGWRRGWVDTVLMRSTDVVLMVPVLVVGAVLGNAVGRFGVLPLALVLGLVLWTGLARLVRAQVLGLRELEYVDAARVAGTRGSTIVWRHLLPGTAGVVVVHTTLLMSTAILLETAISYLGFGVRSPDVSLGMLIGESQDSFTTRPWLFWWPGLFIVLISVSVNLVGEAMRRAWDPRSGAGTRRRGRAGKVPAGGGEQG